MQFRHLGCLVDSRSKRQKLTQLLPKSRSAVLGLHTNVRTGALDDSAGSFDSHMLEAHVVALLRVHAGADCCPIDCQLFDIAHPDPDPGSPKRLSADRARAK